MTLKRTYPPALVTRSISARASSAARRRTQWSPEADDPVESTVREAREICDIQRHAGDDALLAASLLHLLAVEL